MINVNNSQTNNVFKDFPDLKFGQPQIAVNTSLLNNKPDTIELKKDSDPTQQLASVKVSDTEQKKGKKGGLVAVTAGTAILTAGVLAMVFTKGFSSTSYKKINELIEHLNGKIYDSSIAEKSKTLFHKGTISLAKGLKSVLSGFKAVSNFNAVKDGFIKKIFDLTPVTKKFADNATSLFKKISFDSIKSGYNKSHLETYEFCDDFIIRASKLKSDKSLEETLGKKIKIKVDGKIECLTIRDILTKLEELSKKTKSTFDDGFGHAALVERQAVRAEELKGVSEYVNDALYKDNGGLFKLNENASRYKTYVTEDASSDAKMKLKTMINDKRKAFTNNVEHNVELMKSSVQEMSSALDVEDPKSRKMLSEISEKIQKYNACDGPKELTDRAKVKIELAQVLEKFNLHIAEAYKGNDKVIDAIEAQTKFITRDVFESDKKGLVQELMTIVKSLHECDLDDGTKLQKALINAEEFDAIDKKSKSITSNITKIAKKEGEDLLDKHAELEVGSAPSDLVGLAIPIGAAAYAISKGDDTDERISTTLTTGIPLVGSIGAMGYGILRNVSGVKNMGLGLGVGFVLNLVGNAFDKLYKNYQEKRSFTQMAIDAYRNNTILPQFNNNKN